jgi:hypothetical protein
MSGEASRKTGALERRQNRLPVGDRHPTRGDKTPTDAIIRDHGE